MNKYKVDDTVALNGVGLKIVAIDSFNPVNHYGINWIQKGEFYKVAGWIPCHVLDVAGVKMPGELPR